MVPGCFKNIDKLSRIKSLDLRSLNLADSDIDNFFQLMENRWRIYKLSLANVMWGRMMQCTLQKHIARFKQRDVQISAATYLLNRKVGRNISVELLAKMPIEKMHVITCGYVDSGDMRDDIKKIIQENIALVEMHLESFCFDREWLEHTFINSEAFERFIRLHWIDGKKFIVGPDKSESEKEVAIQRKKRKTQPK